jgi:hypothetical protein
MSRRPQEDRSCSKYLLQLVPQDTPSQDFDDDNHTYCSVSLQDALSGVEIADVVSVGRTKTTSTTTVTVTSVSCEQQKREVAPIVRGTFQGVEYSRIGDLELERRTDVLPLLRGFAAAKISEGCSCLNLQPKVTQTATLTAPAPVWLSPLSKI